MRIHTYVIDHDLGFAPNPFFRVCTLANCKPVIRQHAKLGDYIIGTGATKPNILGCMSYWMRVDEIISFDEYWDDERFRLKRPFMRGSRMRRYGDNIYHTNPETGDYIQEDSFHSEFGGGLSIANRERDTGRTSNVLIGHSYAYWGSAGPEIPVHLSDFIVKGTGHKCRFKEDRKKAFMKWLSGLSDRGFLGEPAHWKYLKS